MSLLGLHNKNLNHVLCVALSLTLGISFHFSSSTYTIYNFLRMSCESLLLTTPQSPRPLLPLARVSAEWSHRFSASPHHNYLHICSPLLRARLHVYQVSPTDQRRSSIVCGFSTNNESTRWLRCRWKFLFKFKTR